MKEEGKNHTAIEAGPFAALQEKVFKGVGGKFFIGGELGLTGCEVSLNRLPAGKGTPFVHAHKKNEEVYIIIGGEGTFYVDGSEFPVREGSIVRVAPAGERACKAGGSDLCFICIQAEAGSLTQATLGDGIRLQTKASWMNG
jgi:uncharacterized cupin superfamily protein